VVALGAFFVTRAGSNGGGGDDGDRVATTVSTTAGATASSSDDIQVGASGPIVACTGDEGAGQPTVEEADLPRQARQTLDLITAGGPFPYDQDGAVFQNREGVLPKESSGYYHEYTVSTPGSDDRGAQRIVTGACGEQYYTDDHYDSFHLVVVGD
jgi:ribonuclease T1